MSGYKSRALVVDESVTATSILVNFLTTIGFSDVDRAVDGIAALKKLQSRYYSLIVCDCDTRPMSGLDLRAAIDASETLRDIPILLVSAQAPPSPMACADPGLSDVALTLFTVDALREKVEGLLDAKNRRDALRGVSQI